MMIRKYSWEKLFFYLGVHFIKSVADGYVIENNHECKHVNTVLIVKRSLISVQKQKRHEELVEKCVI